jgi:hypothetical protein
VCQHSTPIHKQAGGAEIVTMISRRQARHSCKQSGSRGKAIGESISKQFDGEPGPRTFALIAYLNQMKIVMRTFYQHH